jgi:radical SAM superfamily enzyme YgiQ (UPF0313 family)
MNITILDLYPVATAARFMLAPYLLKAFVNKQDNDDRFFAVTVLDIPATSPVEKIIARIKSTNPDCVAYSCYVWNALVIQSVIAELKNSLIIPQVLGGPEISEETMKEYVEKGIGDYFIMGEGEVLFYSLLRFIAGTPLLPDSGFPDGIGRIVNNTLAWAPSEKSLKNLDDVPSIYVSGAIDERLYAKQQAFVETRRGCRYKCAYCVYPRHRLHGLVYSDARIFEELTYLIVNKQVSAIRFFDADFLSDMSRAKRIVSFLGDFKKRGITLPWIYWEFNAHDVDEEFLSHCARLKAREGICNSASIEAKDRAQHYSELLADYTVINCIGIQSFNELALKTVRRHAASRSGVQKILALAKHLNVVFKFDFILGLPKETEDSYWEGMSFFVPLLQDTDHVLNIHVLEILPGSDLEKKCSELKIVYNSDAPHQVYSTMELSRMALRDTSRLTALLFRTVNSPLRGLFFKSFHNSGKTLKDFLWTMYQSLDAFGNLPVILRDDVLVDDEYWNAAIFGEIPSQCIIDLFTSAGKKIV